MSWNQSEKLLTRNDYKFTFPITRVNFQKSQTEVSIVDTQIAIGTQVPGSVNRTRSLIVHLNYDDWRKSPKVID